MLTKDQQDEYIKAFGAEPEDDAPEGESGDAASAVTLNDVPTDEPAETAEAPEVVAEAPTEEATTEESSDVAESPEDTQRRKSWEGRLKKMEEELKAREAALASREAPAALADGGKVENEDGPVTLDEGAGDGTVTLTNPEKYADGGEVDSLDSIRDEAMELAGDPEKLGAVLKTMIADYGREFVVGAVALAAPLIDAKAEGYVKDFNGDLEGLVSEIQQSFSSMHRNAISDAHEDFEEVVEGEAFKEWLASLEEAQRAKAEQVVESGSAGQIIKLLGQFKEFVAEKDKPKEKAPEDVWAEDAATSIRSSAPLKLPTRAPSSDDDEYSRAFNEA